MSNKNLFKKRESKERPDVITRPASEVVESISCIVEPDDVKKIHHYLSSEFPIAEMLLKSYDGNGSLKLKQLTPVFGLVREAIDTRFQRRTGIFVAFFLNQDQRQLIESCVAKTDSNSVAKWTPDDVIALLGYKSSDAFYKYKISYMKRNFPQMVVNAITDPSFGAFLGELQSFRELITSNKTDDQMIGDAVARLRDELESVELPDERQSE